MYNEVLYFTDESHIFDEPPKIGMSGRSIQEERWFFTNIGWQSVTKQMT